jgi:hypothetical protein
MNVLIWVEPRLEQQHVVARIRDKLPAALVNVTNHQSLNTLKTETFSVTQTCGSSTTYNNTYFVNSGYPQTFGGGSRCNMQVTRSGSDVCQLRVDFLDFSLAQPTGDGACTNDYFTITGGSSPVPRICGENSGHHVYVDFSGNNPITITVATSGSFTFNRRHHFHLQMIGCDSPSKGLLNFKKHTKNQRRLNF